MKFVVSLPGDFSTGDPALEHLQSLYGTPPSSPLQQYLATFKEPKKLDQETLMAGMQQCEAFLNIKPEDREQFFGSLYGGVHYSDTLTEIWNKQHFPGFQSIEGSFPSDPNFLFSCQLEGSLYPPSWKIVEKNSNNLSLQYEGKHLNGASGAMDELFQGPTIIDCGAACWLIMFSGLRYALGNDRFNQLFDSLLIASERTSSTCVLQNFFDPQPGASYKDFAQDNIVFSSFSNCASYRYKHPSSVSQAYNVLYSNDCFLWFNPDTGPNALRTEAALQALLLNSYNQPWSIEDHTIIFGSYKNRNFDCLSEDKMGKSYTELLSLATQLKDHQMNQESWLKDAYPDRPCQSGKEGLVRVFNIEALKLWIEKQDQLRDLSSFLVMLNKGAAYTKVATTLGLVAFSIVSFVRIPVVSMKLVVPLIISTAMVLPLLRDRLDYPSEPADPPHVLTPKKWFSFFSAQNTEVSVNTSLASKPQHGS